MIVPPVGSSCRYPDSRSSTWPKSTPSRPRKHGIDFLMDHRHLWLRSSKQWALLRVRATVIRAIRDWLDGNGFLLVDSPILTPAACEGTTTLFETEYFGEKAYLSQSGQLYNEATAMAFGRTYCFGPTFRAEKSKTRRHLIEFWMVEPEMAYVDPRRLHGGRGGLCLLHRANAVSTTAPRNSRCSSATPPNWSGSSRRFRASATTMRSSCSNEAGQEFEWGEDFGAPHETFIAERFDKPVFVHRYPAKCKAFYMAADPDDPRLSLSVDLLAPEGYGEIIGGGQRSASLELLEQRIAEHGLPKEAFEWYLDLRRYGSVYHSGFGLGRRAHRDLDHRRAPHSPDHPVPAHAGTDVPLDRGRA